MVRDLSKFLAAEKALWSKYGITPTERRVQLRAGNEVRIQQVGEGLVDIGNTGRPSIVGKPYTPHNQIDLWENVTE